VISGAEIVHQEQVQKILVSKHPIKKKIPSSEQLTQGGFCPLTSKQAREYGIHNTHSAQHIELSSLRVRGRLTMWFGHPQSSPRRFFTDLALVILQSMRLIHNKTRPVYAAEQGVINTDELV